MTKFEDFLLKQLLQHREGGHGYECLGNQESWEIEPFFQTQAVLEFLNACCGLGPALQNERPPGERLSALYPGWPPIPRKTLLPLDLQTQGAGGPQTSTFAGPVGILQPESSTFLGKDSPG